MSGWRARAVDLDARKLEWAREFGATHTVNASDGDPVEAIKALTGAGTSLRGSLLIYDGLYGETRKITTKPRPDCPVCGH